VQGVEDRQVEQLGRVDRVPEGAKCPHVGLWLTCDDGPVLETSPQAREVAPADLLPHLRRAKDLVDSQYAEAVDLDRLAASAGCSRFHFLRMFRATYAPSLYRDRAAVAKGALGAGVFATDDCQATFQELSGRGVTFVQPPQDRPYGVEALLRDNSGNWFSLTQRKV
jgi:hypothetical protein